MKRIETLTHETDRMMFVYSLYVYYCVYFKVYTLDIVKYMYYMKIGFRFLDSY